MNLFHKYKYLIHVCNWVEFLVPVRIKCFLSIPVALPLNCIYIISNSVYLPLSISFFFSLAICDPETQT